MLLIIYRGWLADVYVIILFCIQKKKSNSNGVSFSFFFERERSSSKEPVLNRHVLLRGLVGLPPAGIMGCFLAVYVI